MEPDISILQKTGHFYFALTRSQNPCGTAPIAGFFDPFMRAC
jgi:hypothetical protein